MAWLLFTDYPTFAEVEAVGPGDSGNHSRVLCTGNRGLKFRFTLCKQVCLHGFPMVCEKARGPYSLLTQGSYGKLKDMHPCIQVKAEVDVQPVHCAHQVLLSVHHLHNRSPVEICKLP